MIKTRKIKVKSIENQEITIAMTMTRAITTKRVKMRMRKSKEIDKGRSQKHFRECFS